MPKQVVTTELDGIKTDTIDRLDAVLTFDVSGTRNVPNLENVGKAADAATWLFQCMLENSFNKNKEVHEAGKELIRTQTEQLLATS